MNKINKLSIPVTILLSSVVLGGFYFASQLVKQNSIERQQLTELRFKEESEQTKKDEESKVRLEKLFCVNEAQQNAVELNKESCARGEYCLKGEDMYLIAQYENSYKTCLQRKGLQ